jgi:1-acyl-sn-glycerol-3-phosphate acyltransferase
MNDFLRALFFLLLVRPLVKIILGLNIRHQERLPVKGPAIIAANHNSHLDTLVLFSLFPLSMLPRIRAVAAMDYWMRSGFLAWFSLNIIGIVPIRRKRDAASPSEDPLQPCHEALARGDILLFFPEGTRGEPEKMASLKMGISKLCEKHPDLPVVPVFLHGLGKALPKGDPLLVPFFCDVFVGETQRWTGDAEGFRSQLETKMHDLAAEGNFAALK